MNENTNTIGAVANGHVLTEQGWVPIAETPKKKKHLGLRIAGGTVAGLALFSACMSSLDSAVEDTTTTTTTDGGITAGLGTADASKDVSLGKSVTEYGWTTLSVKVKNNSDGRSDYFITVVAESKDGSEQYDSTVASAMKVEPGQKATAEAFFSKQDLPSDTVFRVTEVQRTASL